MRLNGTLNGYLEHTRKSHCNCPHAKGKRIICKHQVALYFSVFPREGEKYYKEVLEYEEEEKRRQEELDKKVVAYINGKLFRFRTGCSRIVLSKD